MPAAIPNRLQLTGYLLGEAALSAGVEAIGAAETEFTRFVMQAAATGPRPPEDANLFGATVAAALQMVASLASRGRRALAVSDGMGLRAAAEQLAFAQLAGHPVVLAHCQQPPPGAAPDSPCDADVALACHLGAGGAPLPVFAVAGAGVLPAVLRRAFDGALQLRSPVIVLLSTHLVDSLGSDTVTRLNAASFAADSIEDVTTDIDPEAHTLLISYGAADSAAREALARVRAAGLSASHLTIHGLWPLPERSLRRATTPLVTRLLIPECNQGQYAAELARVARSGKLEPLSCLAIESATDLIVRRMTEWPCG